MVFSPPPRLFGATLVRSAAPRLLPAGESPFPPLPWHTAHLALNVVALLSPPWPCTGAVQVKIGRIIPTANAATFPALVEIISAPPPFINTKTYYTLCLSPLYPPYTGLSHHPSVAIT